MPFNSPDSRRAAEFDAFRRELVLRSKTVSGERRELWLEKMKGLVEAMFPDTEINVRKPGLATRLFSAEVALPGRDKQHLLDLAQELDDNWRSMVKDEVKNGASCVYLDRLDGIWEWAVDLGDSFVTGHVKLRNYPFEGAPPTDREGGERPRYGDRDRGGRPGYKGRPGPPFDRSRSPHSGPSHSGPPHGDRPYRPGGSGGYRGRPGPGKRGPGYGPPKRRPPGN